MAFDGAYGTVVEPLGKGNKQTVKPSLGIVDSVLENSPIAHAMFRSLFGDSQEESTIVEPKEQVHWRGRPTIYLPKFVSESKKPNDEKNPSARKTALSYLDKFADVGGKKLSLNELYRSIRNQGIEIIEKPYSWLQNRFGNCIGYRDGNTIYVANHLPSEAKKATAMHELFENPYEPHEKCQSKALEFARKVDPEAYKVLWKMGRTIGLN